MKTPEREAEAFLRCSECHHETGRMPASEKLAWANRTIERTHPEACQQTRRPAGIRNVVRRLLEHDDAISTKLAAFAKEDQQPRNEYVKYLAKYPSWQEASKTWQKEKQVPPDDVFGDRKRQPEYKKFISDHLEGWAAPGLCLGFTQTTPEFFTQTTARRAKRRVGSVPTGMTLRPP